MIKMGIAMIPDSVTLEAVINLQEQVSIIEPLKPTLGKYINLPHMTLLQGRFSDLGKVHQLIPELQKYLQEIYHQHSENLNFYRLKYIYKSPGWYFLQPQPDGIGHQAHQFCFNHLKNIMVLLECDRQKNMGGYSPSEIQKYQKYGYRYIEQDFCPHFTLGRTLNRLPSQQIDKYLQSIPDRKINISGSFERITLYRVGDFGSHAESLMDLNIEF